MLGVAQAEQQGQHFYDAELHRLRAEILFEMDGNAVEEGETLFGQSLEIARRQEAKAFELRATTSLARLWQRQGQARRGPRPPRSALRLVHRRLRHARPEGRAGAAGGAVGAPILAKGERDTIHQWPRPEAPFRRRLSLQSSAADASTRAASAPRPTARGASRRAQ